MRILVYGAGVLGGLHAARLYEAGHHVSLVARGERFTTLQQRGVLLARGNSPVIEQLSVPVVDTPAGRYDATLVFVRTHQVDAVLQSIAEFNSTDGGDSGDVLFLLNWAAGPEPLGDVIGHERVLLGFANSGGTMDGEVIRYRRDTLLTRFVSMSLGEPDGRTTPRLERIIQTLRSAGFKARVEPQMDAWLKTHAAFEVPLGQAVHAAGGLEALAGHPPALRSMIEGMRQNLASLPGRPVPRAFNALRIVPEAVLVPVFRRFLRSTAAEPLSTDSPAVSAELDRLASQLRALARHRPGARDSRGLELG